MSLLVYKINNIVCFTYLYTTNNYSLFIFISKKLEIIKCIISGVISIVLPLDYERTHDYLLSIQATDLGIPPLSSQATVNISIIDSNDNAPIFSEISYETEINEDCNIGDVVIQVLFLLYSHKKCYSHKFDEV